MRELEELTFSALCSTFLETDELGKIFQLDEEEICEDVLSYCFDEVVFEILKRPRGNEFIISNLDSWDALRQASCIAVMRNDHRLLQFAYDKLTSTNDLLRAAAFYCVCQSEICVLTERIQGSLTDTSALIRGMAIANAVKLSKWGEGMKSQVQSLATSQGGVVENWYRDAVDESQESPDSELFGDEEGD